MKTAGLTCALLFCMGLASVCTAEAGLPSVVNCTVVQCLVDPCTTTTCKPTNTDWQCVANYCGGCNTDWQNKKTGLKISTCPPDACTEIFDPVCGVDGKTYSSSCHALLVGVKVAYKGECKKCNIVQCLIDPCRSTKCKPTNPDWKCVANYCNGCKTDWKHTKTGLKISTCPPDVCPLIYAPVCGTTGKTYDNDCVALANGAKVASQGACKPKCPKTKDPVCGKDGISYRNRCLARSNGTTVAYTGTCLFPKKCDKVSKKYKPVCDTAAKLTWTNACVAKLNKAATTTNGPCIGPICAMCTKDAGCGQPHRCKGNKKYTCELASCEIQHVLDNGKRVTYGLCSAIYRNKATGYPAAACYP